MKLLKLTVAVLALTAGTAFADGDHDHGISSPVDSFVESTTITGSAPQSIQRKLLISTLWPLKSR